MASHSRYYSTSHVRNTNNNKLNPFFITGITDAEGTFSCIIRKSVGHRLGWRVEVIYQIGLHKKDLELLKEIQAFYGGIGLITKPSKNMCAFRVSSLKELSEKIFPHFDKYNLITKKLADYLLFKQIVTMMNQALHLTEDGIQVIMNIRASLNLGISVAHKRAFPKTIPVKRPIIPKGKIPQPEWMAGFVTGEGCFFIKKIKVEI